MSEKVELRKCWHCGIKVISERWCDSPDGDTVFCDGCGQEFTLDFWQSRPLEDALQAKLDRAVLALEEIEYTTYEVGIQKIARTALDALEQLEADDGT